MKTALKLFQLATRLGSFCIIALSLAGLPGCDQSAPSTSPSASNGLSTPEPPAEPISFQESQIDRPLPFTNDRPRIVAFGDSLTAGFGVSPEQSYPARLQQQLDALGYEYQVINAGVSGETTAGGLRRVPWILAGQPRLVILELGGNDGLRGLSLADIRSHLNAIIQRFKEANVQVLLAGMKIPPNYGKEYTSRFERIYHELATSHSLPLIPFLLEGVGGDQILNQADGIHPTGDGYRVVADNVLKSLLPLLEEMKADSSDIKRRRETSHRPHEAEPRSRHVHQYVD
ncbi:MAG: tesA [Nitrospira sp.]|jgi:acyl-CoA thioesterase-1|nr:tesA [Nitrospira sp.]